MGLDMTLAVLERKIRGETENFPLTYHTDRRHKKIKLSLTFYVVVSVFISSY